MISGIGEKNGWKKERNSMKSYHLYLKEDKDKPLFCDSDSHRVIKQAVALEKSANTECEVFQFIYQKDNIIDVEQIY